MDDESLRLLSMMREARAREWATALLAARQVPTPVGATLDRMPVVVVRIIQGAILLVSVVNAVLCWVSLSG